MEVWRLTAPQHGITKIRARTARTAMAVQNPKRMCLCSFRTANSYRTVPIVSSTRQDESKPNVEVEEEVAVEDETAYY